MILASIYPFPTFCKSSLYVSIFSALGSTYAFAAQENKNSQHTKDMEVIEVRGIRSSMAENLDVKRMSGSVVDAITAEDIGKFPDKNVADSLQRVPGVVIERDGGEGSSVSIRGLSSALTFTQLNGNFIASSPGEPSRSFDYALLPSSMIESVEVYKSPEARLDEGGVGGTVLMHSRKPLSMDANSGVFNVESTYADVTKEYEPQFTGLYSWKNDNENFGVLVGYTHQERTNRTLSGGTDANVWRYTGGGQPIDIKGNAVDNNNGWDTINDAGGNSYDGVWFPQVVRGSVLNEKREREGIQFSTQWRPTNRLELGFNYFGFTLGQDRTESVIDIPEWSLNSDFLTDVNLDESRTIITGMQYDAMASGIESDMQFPWMRGSYVREESTSDTFDFNLTYEGDNFKARFVVGNTKSEGGPEESWEAAYKSSNAGENATAIQNAAQMAGWSLNQNNVSLNIDPNTLANLQSGIGGGRDAGSSNSSFVRSELEEDYYQADVDLYVDWGFLKTIRTGVKYRNSTLHRETGNTFFLDPNFDIAAGEASEQGITRFDSHQWNGGMPLAQNVFTSESNIVGGFDINQMPSIDWDKYRDMVTTSYVPYTRIEDNFVYDIEEKISAFYIQGDFEFSEVRGNLGVRVVQTKTLTSSTDLYTYQLDHTNDETGEPVTGDARFVEDYQLVTQRNEDTQILPSFNIAWDATDDLVIRGAIAKVMSRPDYSDLGAQQRITFVSDEWANDRAAFNEQPGFSGSGGNKNLKPFESVQADLSIEYYYAKGSAVGLALFHKKVDNFVVPLVIDVEQNFAGKNNIVDAGIINIAPYSTVGNGTDAISKGAEVFIQHAFDNGFGFYANYTYNKTNKADVTVNGKEFGQSALIGSAKYQYNTSVYYEGDAFNVRASYNKRGETVLGINSGLNVYQDPYEQVDVNASVNLYEGLSLTAAVINLTKSESVTRLGDDTDARLLNSSYSGRRYYAGFNYSF
ncbi:MULTISPECIES: TonB-dependent receptor [Pseudoalteromonas]|uniref:TonB-dependent receptor n=1 Tax=Pseudoalteromonas TaxID=53246 RepID=UPI000C33E701|nr:MULTISPECIES: TonB-dependent receptor [Pseudoalteromonas]PKG66725.1 TonB-dependent receptor [Pseudoalteromonas arctica]PKG71849.1 TonB-dependent receptor [Pseudoalteromonas sp. GutCa3]